MFLILIFEILLELKYRTGGINIAFLHATLNRGERTFMEMPLSFKKGKLFIINTTSLTNSIVSCLKAGSLWNGSIQADPCSFIKGKIVWLMICYSGTRSRHIHELATLLC